MLAAKLLLLLLPPALAPLPQGDALDAATPTATFRLPDGTTATVTRGDLALEMAFELRRQDDGRAACKQLVKTWLVRHAAAGTDCWPAADLVRARWEQLREQLKAAGRALDQEPILRNCSEATLLDYLAIDLAHERLVRKQLSLKDSEQVSPAMLELWLDEARTQTTVVDDPDQLPLGTAVRVDGRDVPMLELGLLLLRSSSQDEQDKYLRKVVVLACIENMARGRDLSVSADELERELSLRRALAQTDPRLRGIGFEQLLKATGHTVETLLQSRVFRVQVLQKKLVALQHPRAELQAQLEADRQGVLERFGPRRHLAVLFARALAEPNALVPRDFAAATAQLEAVRQRLAKEKFEEVARIESDDAGTKQRGGEAGWHNRRDESLPAEVLAAAWRLRENEVSTPVRTAAGMWLVKVLEIEGDLGDEAVVGRMRESLVTDLTAELLRQAAITRADGTKLDGDATAGTGEGGR